MRTENDALRSLQRHVAAALPTFKEILLEVEAGQEPERPFAVVSADEWTATEHVGRPWVTLPTTISAYVKGASRLAAREAAQDAREALWHALRVGEGAGRERLVPLFDYTGRPAVQHVEFVRASGGTFALQHGAEWTAPLLYPPQPRHVRLALEALPDLEPGDVWVFGKRGGPLDVRFDGRLRGDAVPLMAADVADLDGTNPGIVVSEVAAGSADPWRDPRDFLTVEAPSFGGMPDPADARLRTVTVGVRLTWGRNGRVRSPEMTLRAIHARA